MSNTRNNQPIKVSIAGINGRMGQEICRLIDESDFFSLSGGLFSSEEQAKIYKSKNNVNYVCSSQPAIAFVNSQLIIDFSSVSSVHKNVKAASQVGAAYLCGVTGLTKKDVDYFDICSTYIPILHESNFSIGIMVIKELIKKATSILTDDYDIEILDYHHNKKLDAPSGTALALGKEILSVRSPKTDIDEVKQFHNKLIEKRQPGKIGFSAIRGGAIIGEHQVGFYSDYDSIEIIHKARDRRLFADGALKAGYKLYQLKPGVYSLKEVLSK